MIDVDALTDAKMTDEPIARGIYAQARRLISSSDDNPLEFTTRYLDVLQSDPALVLEHAAERRILDSLEASTYPDVLKVALLQRQQRFLFFTGCCMT